MQADVRGRHRHTASMPSAWDDAMLPLPPSQLTLAMAGAGQQAAQAAAAAAAAAAASQQAPPSPRGLAGGLELLAQLANGSKNMRPSSSSESLGAMAGGGPAGAGARGMAGSAGAQAGGGRRPGTPQGGGSAGARGAAARPTTPGRDLAGKQVGLYVGSVTCSVITDHFRTLPHSLP